MSKILTFLLLTLSTLVKADIHNGKLEIVKIDEHAYLHTSFYKMPSGGYYPSNGILLESNNAVISIDSPWSVDSTKELVEWVEEKGFVLKSTIFTHSHHDRVAGLSYLNRLGVSTYASATTNRLLSEASMESATVELPEREIITFSDGVEIYFPGHGHTSDNIVVWSRQNKLLFAGCLVKDMTSTGLGGTGDANLEFWPKAIKNILVRYHSAKYVVPGHGEIGGVELTGHTLNLLRQHNNAKL